MEGASRKDPVQRFFHADEGGGVKPHFLFMRFHGLLLVVPERRARRLPPVCLRATSKPPEANIDILY